MNELRRSLLKGGTSALALPWIGSGLLTPTRVWAGEWNKTAFTAKNIQEALKGYGAGNPQESRDLLINGPEIAENGAKVEIEVSSNLPNTRSLAVFADKNPMPLCASLDLAPSVVPFARLQLKLAESTRIRLIAKTADGKTHVASREIKVTLGGCGG